MAKLYFRYAAMNAGKSTMILQSAYNYEERGMKVTLMTAEIDNRNGIGKVSSRLGLSRDAKTFSKNLVMDISILEKDTACLFIDEAQFLTPKQAKELHILAHTKNIPIICYGLRADFLGNAFAGAAALLTLADDLEEMKTICECGKKASMNARFSDGKRVFDGEQVMIGSNAQYLSMCPDCFYS